MTFLITSFWGVPVNNEPCSVHGSNEPAVCPEHVDEQNSAGSTWSKTQDQSGQSRSRKVMTAFHNTDNLTIIQREKHLVW